MKSERESKERVVVSIMRIRLCVACVALALGVTSGCIGLIGGDRVLWAAKSAAPMPSDSPETWKSLVADADLAAMIDIQRAEIAKSMKSNGTFRRGLKKLEGCGRMIAILGNVQVYRGEWDDAKKAAALRAAGLALTIAAEAKNFDDAKKAADEIAAYPDKIAPADDAAPTTWTDLVGIDAVMLGVSTADSETKTAVLKEGDFKKAAKDAEAYAMLLAVLGTISRDYEEADDWKQWCDQMRDSSAGLAKAFGKKNFDASKSARDEMLKSCDACHMVYRPEE